MARLVRHLAPKGLSLAYQLAPKEVTKSLNLGGGG